MPYDMRCVAGIMEELRRILNLDNVDHYLIILERERENMWRRLNDENLSSLQ